jgi:hypothetical protein
MWRKAMKSIQNLLSSFYNQLNTIEDLTCYHYERAEDYSLPYGVWAETGESDSFNADNGKKEQVIEGTMDFYTETEFDPLFDEIQSVLDEMCCGWVLDSVQYEDSTKLIHYTWNWEMV